jgi:hypothetical protein
MWRLLVLAVFAAVLLYYATLVLHLTGIVRIGKKKAFSVKHLIPFKIWIED